MSDIRLTRRGRRVVSGAVVAVLLAGTWAFNSAFPVDVEGEATSVELMRMGKVPPTDITAQRRTEFEMGLLPLEAPRATVTPTMKPRASRASSRSYARLRVIQKGWGARQWGCLDRLWNRESRWNHLARNHSSGAYGIPQALPGNKMRSAGADWRTNPRTQIKWGLRYVEQRYGTPCRALNHALNRGYY